MSNYLAPSVDNNGDERDEYWETTLSRRLGAERRATACGESCSLAGSIEYGPGWTRTTDLPIMSSLRRLRLFAAIR
jgi:hypothetical protein